VKSSQQLATARPSARQNGELMIEDTLGYGIGIGDRVSIHQSGGEYVSIVSPVDSYRFQNVQRADGSSGLVIWLSSPDGPEIYVGDTFPGRVIVNGTARSWDGSIECSATDGCWTCTPPCRECRKLIADCEDGR
jgi:hypothetical protein